MSPLGSLGGLQLTLIIPETFRFITVTVLGGELGATATHVQQ